MLKVTLLVLLVVVLVIQLLLLAHLNVHGNSATATKLATARKITVSGAVSGSANFDGSGNVTITTTQANVAIVSGTITLTQSTESTVESGQVDINYPSGYTKDNCIVISVMARNSQQTSSIGYSYGVLADENYSGVINSASMGKYVVLKSTSIMLTMRYDWNASPSNQRTDTYNYKIALMKVS